MRVSKTINDRTFTFQKISSLRGAHYTWRRRWCTHIDRIERRRMLMRIQCTKTRPPEVCIAQANKHVQDCVLHTCMYHRKHPSTTALLKGINLSTKKRTDAAQEGIPPNARSARHVSRKVRESRPAPSWRHCLPSGTVNSWARPIQFRTLNTS